MTKSPLNLLTSQLVSPLHFWYTREFLFGVQFLVVTFCFFVLTVSTVYLLLISSPYLILTKSLLFSSLLFSSLLISFSSHTFSSFASSFLFLCFLSCSIPFCSSSSSHVVSACPVLFFSALFCFSFLLFPVNIYSCFILSISLSIPFSQSLLFTFFLLSISIFYSYVAYCVFTYDFSHFSNAHLNPVVLLCLG